jgi:serine/threonine-protein kinase
VAKVRLLDPNDSKRRLDRYELIGELASGGMATVFLGRLGGVGGFQRFVAIKRLHPHLANEEEFIEMFLDEARLAAGIHHPHVVPILEVGESESGYYLVMEYVEGDTLARLMARALARAQPIPRPVLIRIVLDALAGLHAAHELLDPHGNPVSLVHRDVSPQNVLVGVDGCSRITDFGVAHAASRLQSTRADRLKGKLAYMAPEQARSGHVDQRADIFAMGVILWEVLASRRLFKAETEAVTLQKVTVDPIPRLGSMVAGLHPAIEAVADKALERNPERRYRTAADMAEALERAAREAASSSATDLGVASPREVAAYVQGALGDDIAAQRESVRAWLAHSEPSLPRSSGARLGESGKLGPPPGHDVTMTMPLDRSGSRPGDAKPVTMGPAATIGAPNPGLLPSPVTIGPPLTMGAPNPRTDGLAMGALNGSGPPAAMGAPVLRPPVSAQELTLPSHASARKPTLADAPFARGARQPRPPGQPFVSMDGADPGEVPVEPVDDDDDDHETQLMDRRAAVAQVTAARVDRKAAHPALPASPSTPHTDERPPSTSIESFMAPASPVPKWSPRATPPNSRTPQLVALGVGLFIAVGGLVMWQLRGQAPAAPPAISSPGSAAQHPPVAPATLPPQPAATVEPAPALPSTPTAATSDVIVTPRLKGKMPRAKGSHDSAAPAPVMMGETPKPPSPPPVAPVPAPATAKLPEDMANPYR